jgi:hypothetical protein
MALLERTNTELGYPDHIFYLAVSWETENRGKSAASRFDHDREVELLFGS